MMLQSRYLGAWANVAHADICHGHAHVHLKPAPNSEKELVHHVARLDLASHVGDAFDACHDFLDKLGKQIRDNTNEEETDDGHTAIAR